MKALLLCLAVIATSTTHLSAQSRVSIAPTYWFNYNPYSYQIKATFNGSTTQNRASGHSIVSSVGLTARYQFTPQWDISVGAFYCRNTNHIKTPRGPYGEFTPFTSTGWQVPVLVSYRLTEHRLSPYFSTGALITRSTTFTGRPITTDGVVGGGLTYRIDSGLSFLLQATASHCFYRPANDAVYTVTQYSSYSLGVQTQLIWRF